MITRRTFIAAAAATPITAALVRPALAMTPPVYAEGGIAIDGSDAVAYFDGNGPVPGSAEHSVDWNGATWRFASAENAEAFRTSPEAYAPQYGGYCAFALSKNAIAPTDPEAWSIVDGKLYLNFSTQVRMVWSEDIPGNIARADANWPSVLDA